jgi:hypothetical protein
MTEAICTKADEYKGDSSHRPWSYDPCPEGYEANQKLCCWSCTVKNCFQHCDVSKSFETCIYKNKASLCVDSTKVKI